MREPRLSQSPRQGDSDERAMSEISLCIIGKELQVKNTYYENVT